MNEYDEEPLSPVLEVEESIYLNCLFVCRLLLDNLEWSLITSGLQPSEQCVIMSEQIQDMKEIIDSVLAVVEVDEYTVFH